MEALLKPNHQEKYQSFDILAGVNAIKHDLEYSGYVLPQTREQVLNEGLSYITEGIDRSAKTSFVFQRRGDDLVYFYKGGWHPYQEMLDAGKTAAVYDAAIDPRRQFLVERADNDHYQHEQNKRLKPGEQRTWVSPYPHDVETRYGKELIKQCGLNPDRKLGFIYQAKCLADGSIVLESQTIDNSDDTAFSAVLTAASSDPAMNMSQLVDVYDRFMNAKYGGSFHAGRRGITGYDNAWTEVLNHDDLIGYLVDGLISLAGSSLDEDQLAAATKQHIYGTWALFAKRLSGQSWRAVDRLGVTRMDVMARRIWLRQEVNRAYSEFVKQGRVLVGCGGEIAILKGEQAILGADSDDVLSAIFGGNESSPTVMKCVTCPICHQKGADGTITYAANKKVITCSKCHKSLTYEL